jgi:hypothetical protein
MRTVKRNEAGYATPHEAGLAGWPGASEAHVVQVEVVGDRAEVVIDTDPSYRYWVYCVRRGDRWYEAVSGNGPTVGWQDPYTIGWN